MSHRYPDKKLIGLTGNIAMGKSLVCKMLQELGAATIDADRVAHQVLRKGEAAYADIVANFGREILDDEGEIVRAALGRIVFADAAQLRKLEAITHPAIGKKIDAMIQAAEAKVVVIEAIKLLEGNFKNLVDAVWVVDAPREAQLQRLIETRGMTVAEAEQRIAAQNSQAEKLRRAQVVIKK